MDVVGLVASVITLAQVVIGAVKLAKTLYKAPEELQALQDQLENFNNLVQEIDDLHMNNSSTDVAKSLAKAQVTIEQLHQLIQVKLLRNLNGGTSRARRRAWARNRAKVHSLRDALRESRENLVTTLSANSS